MVFQSSKSKGPPGNSQSHILQALSGFIGANITLLTKTEQRWEGEIASTSAQGNTSGVTLRNAKELTNHGAPRKPSVFIASTNIDSYTSTPAPISQTSVRNNPPTSPDLPVFRGFVTRERDKLQRDRLRSLFTEEMDKGMAEHPLELGLQASTPSTDGPSSTQAAMPSSTTTISLGEAYSTNPPDVKAPRRRARKGSNKVVHSTAYSSHIVQERGSEKYGAGANQPAAVSNNTVTLSTVPSVGPDHASKMPILPTAVPDKTLPDPLPAFREFLAVEKQRLWKWKQELIRNEMNKCVAELGRFSQSFHLNKPIPGADLTSPLNTIFHTRKLWLTFAQPSQSAYFDLVQSKLPPQQFEQLHRAAHPLIQEGVDPTPHVLAILQQLCNHPRLLRGINCIIPIHFKIHCLTTIPKIRHFVLANEGTRSAQIYSLDNDTTSPSLNEKDVLRLLSDGWDDMVAASSDIEWLSCVAQVLQEIVDNPQTEESVKPTARTRLYRLGKRAILPPSMFIHFVDSDIPRYESMREISFHGGFCDAHKTAFNGSPACFRVLRQWESSDFGKEVYKQFCREVSVWHQLRHPNILPLLGATTEAFPGQYCFIVPWIENGTLREYLKTHPNHDKYDSIKQIVAGLNYLHNLDPPVAHKDLKADNILVNSDLVCVITDFGLSSILETQRTTTGKQGTQWWMAPKLGFPGQVSQDARPRDIYALGSTISEILTGCPPLLIWMSVIRREAPEIPPNRVSSWEPEEFGLWEVVKACVAFDPIQRPVIETVQEQVLSCRSY